MNNRDMITIRNKKTGEVKTIPRSQFVIEKPTKGFSGIESDISESLESVPEALVNLVKETPGAVSRVGHYATTRNPVSTLANLGAGGVESATALLSSPQVLARYLSDKFPSVEKIMQRAKTPGVSFKPNDRTLYESLMNFEKEHGLSAQDEEEQTVRSAGGLLFGGGALSKFPNASSRIATVSGEQAGRGGDPLHAALLGLLGEGSSKIPYRRAKNIPEAVSNVVKATPEFANKMTAKGLEALAETAHKSHIPGVPEKLLEKSYEMKYKGVDPQKMAEERLFKNLKLKDLPKIEERAEAGKLLDLDYLTLAELTRSPFEAAKQANIGKTSAGLEALYEKGEGRMQSEGRSIEKLLDTIYNEDKLKPEMKQAYQETMSARVPQEFIDRYSSRPVVQDAIKKLEKNSSYRQLIEDEIGQPLSEIQPDTFGYWNLVKRVLNDMEEKAKDKKGRATTDSTVKGDTRRAMIKEMDKIEPKYEVARNIAERRFTRRKLEDVFDKRDMTGNDFHTFLKSKKNFNDTMHKLKAFPEAQEQLKAMKTLFGHLIPESMPIRHAAALEKLSMTKARNELDAAKKELDEKYGQEHDLAQVNLMTHPDLPRLIREHLMKKKGTP